MVGECEPRLPVHAQRKLLAVLHVEVAVAEPRSVVGPKPAIVALPSEVTTATLLDVK